MDINTFLATLKSSGTDLIKTQISSMLLEMGQDTTEFGKANAKKIEGYLVQLASGEITKEQFRSLMEDVRDLAEMEARKNLVETKASAQRIAKGVTDVILNGLLKLM